MSKLRVPFWGTLNTRCRIIINRDPKKDPNFDNHSYMMQGCHTPPPPAHPMVSPLVVVLFGLVVFPVWSCLASSPPPPVGPVIFLVGPAPPAGGSVFYGDMVWWLPLVSSNVIVTCLVPSPPLWGGACGRFGWPRPIDPAERTLKESYRSLKGTRL